VAAPFLISTCLATGSNETLDYKDLTSYHATRLSTDRRRNAQKRKHSLALLDLQQYSSTAVQ
ncbi:unnamed protein product, partial [Ectocarpus sp. 8 AP-2014]